MNDDGSMARIPDLKLFCETHDLKMLTVADLIRYRMQHERYVHRVAEAQLPTAHGDFRLISYQAETGIGASLGCEGDESHLALVYGDLSVPTDDPVLVRVHTHCLTGSVFGSTLCSCRETVDASLAAIAKAGRGALVYLHHTQPGFTTDRSAHRLGFHRSEGDRPNSRMGPGADSKTQRILRNTGLGGQILSDLGITRIRLLTNHPTHAPALHGFGIEIVDQERIPLREPAFTFDPAL
jgi:3,4-dihydroxy 2-butanone 4-phosphate synthase/GTP cyclohydrolase II